MSSTKQNQIQTGICGVITAFTELIKTSNINQFQIQIQDILINQRRLAVELYEKEKSE